MKAPQTELLIARMPKLNAVKILTEKSVSVTYPIFWTCEYPKKALEFQPSGVKENMIRYVLAFHLNPYTISDLRDYREDGLVKGGAKGCFGIRTELLPWFNEQIVEVEMFDLHTQKFPYKQPLDLQFHEQVFKILRAQSGKVALFTALPDESVVRSASLALGEQYSANTVLWLNTSLAWTLAHTRWGTQLAGDEQPHSSAHHPKPAILQIDLPSLVFEELVRHAVDAGAQPAYSAPNILYENIRDRRIKVVGQIANEYQFVRSGHTIRFGIRGKFLRELVQMANQQEWLEDVTSYAQNAEFSLCVHPGQWLYRELELQTSFFSLPKK